MHPIHYMLGLCFCVWLMYWGYDQLEDDHFAPLGVLVILLAFVLGIALTAVRLRSLI